MKVLFLTVLVAVALANAQTSPDDQVKSQVLAEIAKIQTDFNQMKASGKIDNAKLIEESKTMLALMKSNLDKAPASLKPMATLFVTDMEERVSKMNSTQKFDPKIFKTFKKIISGMSIAEKFGL